MKTTTYLSEAWIKCWSVMGMSKLKIRQDIFSRLRQCTLQESHKFVAVLLNSSSHKVCASWGVIKCFKKSTLKLSVSHRMGSRQTECHVVQTTETLLTKSLTFKVMKILSRMPCSISPQFRNIDFWFLITLEEIVPATIRGQNQAW